MAVIAQRTVNDHERKNIMGEITLQNNNLNYYIDEEIESVIMAKITQ